MKRPRISIVNGYRPETQYRFWNRCRNGRTAWVRLFGVSVAVHAWIT